MKVAFLVNPIAGMGGSVGLKGTDGPDILKEALARGAEPVASIRAVAALRSVSRKALDLEFITCSAPMGADEVNSAGIKAKVVFQVGRKTEPDDTRRAAHEFLKHQPDIILFAGGDGTARDLLGVVGTRVPMLGIPAGVKMHSAVFANTPEAVGDLLETFAVTGSTGDAEVMDVDEDRFREGLLSAKLYGYAKVPDDMANMQPSKSVYHSGTADDEAKELGQYVAETMAKGVAYILGPGSTTAAITNHLGIPKTLLGVDVILDASVLIRDATESQLLKLIENGQAAVVVVTPIGSQGFIFGRGNQQISAKVLRRIGIDNILVVATPTKLRNTPKLRVDTGDSELDESLRRPMKVITGYKRRKLVRVG